MNRKKPNPTVTVEPSSESPFIQACNKFAEETNEKYPDHLFLLFASEPPKDNESSRVAVAWPDDEHAAMTSQLVSGMMAKNKDIAALIITSVDRFIAHKFGEDCSDRFTSMLDDFMREWKTKRRIQEKEMSPDAHRK